MRTYNPSMPDGRPQHQIACADWCWMRADNTVSLPGVRQEATGETTPQRGIPPRLPPHQAGTAEHPFYGIRIKLSVHGLHEDDGFTLVLQTLAQ
jgi:hypothetical protein